MTTVRAEALTDRVRAATAGCSGGSGWIRPEALAHALALDMHANGATTRDLEAVPDEQLRKAARLLDQALHGNGPSFELPFGSRATVGRPGSVEIAGRVFARRPNAPGLHPIESTPCDAGGKTFESFRLMVVNWASSTNARRLGLPSLATIGDGRVRHVIEFPPLAEAGGAVLQYDAGMVDAARFCAAPVRSLEQFCKVVVKDAQFMWRWRSRIAKRIEEVRDAAQAGIALADRYGRRATVGRILVDGRTVRNPEGPSLRVEYLGRDLGTAVAIPSPDGDRGATLFWNDGVIRAAQPAIGGLARLWEVVDQRALIQRIAEADAPLPMEAHIDLSALGANREANGRDRPTPRSGPSLVNTATGTIWPEAGPQRR